jgi:phage tail-like protein
VRNLATDPLRNFKFIVTITQPTAYLNAVPTTIQTLGFMSCDGFGQQNEVIAYREGGDNTTTRKMPGQADFAPLTFARGAMSAPTGPTYGVLGGGTNEVYLWSQMVFSAMEGQGTAQATDNFRTTVTIDVLQHPITNGANAAGMSGGAIKMRFYVMNAWPMGISWSGLDAGGNALLIETLQLAHEGFVAGYATNQTNSVTGASPYLSTSWTPTGNFATQ